MQGQYLVMVGAIALTLTLGANSAPNVLTSPSTADFEAATLAWYGIPNFVATVLNKSIEALVDFFKLETYF